MVTPASLTGDELLAIPLDRPERLFTRSGLRSEYRALAKRWHPDVAGPAGETVFAHVTALYERAEQRLAEGVWDGPGRLELIATDGIRYLFRYRSRRAFELGQILIADSVIAYLVDPSQRDLFDRAVSAISGFRFADTGMRSEMGPCLPEIVARFETDGSEGGAAHLVLVIRKAADLLPLSDTLAHFGGKLPPRHVAWIMSSLFNLACWLEWAGLSHNAIDADAVFLSPRRHQCALLGGWWYSATTGAKLKALPGRSAAAIPESVLRDGRADPRIDGTLLRLLGRDLLGSAIGSRLAADRSIPAPLVAWLRLAADGDAVADYSAWREVLKASFGPRRFVPLRLTADDLYPAAFAAC